MPSSEFVELYWNKKEYSLKLKTSYNWAIKLYELISGCKYVKPIFPHIFEILWFIVLTKFNFVILYLDKFRSVKILNDSLANEERVLIP